MIRVLICAETRIYREGLAANLRDHRAIAVVGTCAGEAEAPGLVRALRPDIVLLDMSTTGGLGLLRELARHVPVVALGVTDSGPEVIACAEAGVSGYVTRTDSLAQLTDALIAVARGEAPCSPRVAAMLLHRVNALADEEATRRTTGRRLTERERQILGLIGSGLSNKQIGRQLSIELPTVKNHVHHILEKLGVSDRQSAAQLSRDLSLL